MEKPQLKRARATEKSKVTRMSSKLKRMMAEDKRDQVKQCLTDLVKQFEVFESAHEAYVVKLEEENELDESDRYFLEAEGAYVVVVESANVWLHPVEVKKIVKDSDSGSVSAVKTEQSVLSPKVLEALNLPKLELCSFDGDPLQYHAFLTAFDEMVDTTAATDSAKLTRLVKSTTGAAKSAIQSCLIVGGTIGYQQARKTLQERFGNDLVVSQAVISMLRDGQPIRSVKELRVLADVLMNCDLVLKRLSSAQEVESQRFIASVVDRLQPFLKVKWKKIAMEMKQRVKKYPTFERLVTFVQTEAETAADPVYGDAGLLRFGRDRPKFGPEVNSGGHSQPRGQQRSQSSSFASNSERKTVGQCPFCDNMHRLYMCNAFKELKAEQKLNFIVEKKLCENCLLDNHVVEKCFRPSMCGVNGCEQKHSRFIHFCKVQVEPVSDS